MLTTGELCERYGIRDWQARRALDALAAGVVKRIALYRLLPEEHFGLFEAELKRRGWEFRRPREQSAVER